MSLRVIVISFLAFASADLHAANFTIDTFVVGIGILDPDGPTSGFAGNESPFIQGDQLIGGGSSASVQYDFWWEDITGGFSITSQLAAETVDGNTVETVSFGRIELTVTEPISILVDAELNFGLPMDQMRAGMSVSYFGINGTPGGGGQGFNYNTLFGTGPNSFVYQTQFDLVPGQYRLGYNMDIDATPSSAGAVGTANGFVEFQIVPEPTMALPIMLCAAALTRRRFRRRAGTMPTQPN